MLYFSHISTFEPRINRMVGLTQMGGLVNALQSVKSINPTNPRFSTHESLICTALKMMQPHIISPPTIQKIHPPPECYLDEGFAQHFTWSLRGVLNLLLTSGCNRRSNFADMGNYEEIATSSITWAELVIENSRNDVKFLIREAI